MLSQETSKATNKYKFVTVMRACNSLYVTPYMYTMYIDVMYYVKVYARLFMRAEVHVKSLRTYTASAQCGTTAHLIAP